MKKEIKIGLIVVVSLLLVYWGSTFLRGSNPFKTKNEFYAVYNDVNGLNVSNAVRYQGYKVGKVKAITYDASKNRWVVSFSIDEKTLQIKDSTVALVSSADILGSMIIELKYINRGSKVLVPGDTVLSEVAKGLQEEVDERLRPLIVKMESLLSSVDSVIKVVHVILDENTVGNLHEAFDKIPMAMNNLLSITNSADSLLNNLEKARIQDIVSNVVSITDNLKKNNEQITGLFKNLKNISDSLAKADVKKTLDGVNSVLAKVDHVVSDIENGKGSLGLLVKDDKLYRDITQSAADLDLLLKDVRENPKRYINISVISTGNKNPKPTPLDTSSVIKLFKPMLKEMVKSAVDSSKAVK